MKEQRRKLAYWPRAERRGKAALLIVVLLVTCCATVASSAADPQVDIAIKPSFKRLYRPGRWMPVIVDVNNTGPEVNDTLCLKQEPVSQNLYSLDDYPGTTRLLETLHLPKNSRKRYFFYLYPGRGEHLTAGLISTRNGARDVVMPIPENRGFLVACGRFDRELNLIMNDPSSKIIRAATVAPHDLPDESIGYDAVDMIFLNECPLETIRPHQWNALLQWLGEGGTLILGGGLAAPEINATPLKECLPYTIAGTMPLNSFKALSRLSELHNPRKQPTISIAQLNGIDANLDVPLAENGIPLAVRSNYQSGRIVFLTFNINDPPFIGIPRFTGLWQTLLNVEYPVKPKEKKTVKKYSASRNQPDLVPEPIAELLKDNLRLPIISLHLIIVFLILYVVLAIPLDYLVARKIGHVFFSVYTFPFIVAAFIIAGIGVGLTTTHISTRQSQRSAVWGRMGGTSWRGTTYARVFLANQGRARLSAGEKKWFFRAFTHRDCDVIQDHANRLVQTHFSRQDADDCVYDWRLPAETIIESFELENTNSRRPYLRVGFKRPEGWRMGRPYLVLIRKLEPRPESERGYELIGACADMPNDIFLKKIPVMQIHAARLTGKIYPIRKRLPPNLLLVLQDRVKRFQCTPWLPRLFLVIKMNRTIGPLSIEGETQERYGDTVLVLEIDLDGHALTID